MKPTGWRFESHRHSLAARGVKTRYLAKKEVRDILGRTPAQLDEIRDNSMSYQKKVHFIPEPYGLPRELQAKDKFYTPEEEKKLPMRDGIAKDEEKRMELRKKDQANKEYFDEIHDMTDAEEIKDILKDMKEEYKEFGMTDAQASKRAKTMMQKSKSFGTALNTSDDPDEFMALKDNLAWFTGESSTDQDQTKWSFGDARDVQREEAWLAYASPTEQFMQSAFFAKKKPWEVPLR